MHLRPPDPIQKYNDCNAAFTKSPRMWQGHIARNGWCAASPFSLPLQDNALEMAEVRAVTCVAGAQHLRVDSLTGAAMQLDHDSGAPDGNTPSADSRETATRGCGIAALSLRGGFGRWQDSAFNIPSLRTLSDLQVLTLRASGDHDLDAPWPPQLRHLDIAAVKQLRITGNATAGLQRLEHLYISIFGAQIVMDSLSENRRWQLTSR